MTGLAPSRVEIQSHLERALADLLGQVEDEPPVRRFVLPPAAA